MKARALLLPGLLLAACQVGKGEGNADGILYVKQCHEGKQDLGALTATAEYHL